jgi:hypothetical protein
VVLAAAVLAAVATVAGVLTHRGLTSGPDTPREAAEAFMSAGLQYDWRTSWELLCRSEQLDRGSLDRYTMVKEAAAAVIGRPDNAGMTVTVGEARPFEGPELEAYVVDVQLARGDETHDMQLVVVAEDDGFRACGQL